MRSDVKTRGLVKLDVAAAPTVGFPTTVAAFTWVEEVLAGRRK